MSEVKNFREFQADQHTENQIPHTIKTDYEENIRRGNNSFYKQGKRSSDSNKKIKRYTIAISIIVLGILISLFFLPIPFGQINVTGSQSITLEDVLFEGNISEPINVLQISTANLEERLSHDIRIESVRVKRRSPFTLSVEVSDRKVVAIMQGQFAYIFLDKEGLVVKTESTIKDMAYPMITGKKLGNVLLGDQLRDEQIHVALTFINGLTADGMKLFSEINIGNVDNLMAYTRNGISVHLANGEDIEKKAVLAESMVNDVEARGLAVEYLDANLAAPFIKLKK